MADPTDTFTMRDLGFVHAIIGGIGLLSSPWIWHAEVASRTYRSNPPATDALGLLLSSVKIMDHQSWWVMIAVRCSALVFVMLLITGIGLRRGKSWGLPLTFLACGVILIPFSALLFYVQYRVLALILFGYTAAIIGAIGVPPIIRLIREMK